MLLVNLDDFAQHTTTSYQLMTTANGTEYCDAGLLDALLEAAGPDAAGPDAGCITGCCRTGWGRTVTGCRDLV